MNRDFFHIGTPHVCMDGALKRLQSGFESQGVGRKTETKPASTKHPDSMQEYWRIDWNLPLTTRIYNASDGVGSCDSSRAFHSASLTEV